jgi:hypothetical protein
LLNGTGMRILASLVVLMLAGCTGVLVEIGPGARPDLAGGGGGPVDMAGGGGPSNAKFFPDVQTDIDSAALSCSLGGCHGGTQAPVLKANAVAGAGDANYTNFMNDVNVGAPDQSLVLTKNLPGAAHGGGSKFSGTNDPVYKKWLGWIQAGAPKQ